MTKSPPQSQFSNLFSPDSPLMASPSMLRQALTQMRAELSRRELERARHDAEAIRARCLTFAGFVKEAWHVIEPGTKLVWNWHLEAICLHLEAIVLGNMKPRLIINVPPGSSKSTVVACLLNAWVWGPMGLRSKKFLNCSFEYKNASRDSTKTRNLIRSEWFQMLWPDVVLVKTGETLFSNTDTGVREACTFEGIMGKRGDYTIFDDPHSLDGAESDVERDKAVRRFIETGQLRVNDWATSALIIIMQRLHENDLSGAVLARSLGFDHLMIPMEFEIERRCQTSIGWSDPRTFDGELMDPVRFPREAVEQYKQDNDYAYAGQFQQRPAPRGGAMFKIPEDWRESLVVDYVPAGGFRIRGWDIAGSTRKTSPFTVGAKLAHTGGLIYIEDVGRIRAEIAEAEQFIADTIANDGIGVYQSIPQDPGSAGKSQRFHLSQRLMDSNFGFSPEDGRKEDRAIPFASQFNAGNVRLVRGPWNEALIHELRNFPNSTFKDQVDALSRAYMEVAKRLRAPVRIPAGPMLIERR